MRQQLLVAAAIAVSLAGLIPVEASADLLVPTPILTPGLTFSTGDKVFSNFTCNVVQSTNGTPLNCDNVRVLSNTSSGNFGIEIQGAFSATGVAATEDLNISYLVHTNDGLISDLHMFTDAHTVPVAITNVTESVFDSDPPPTQGALIGSLSVTVPPGPNAASTNLSELEDDVVVKKDIFLSTGSSASNGSAGAFISIIDQNFSQVPEPASLALFGTALVGFGLIRRRRKST